MKENINSYSTFLVTSQTDQQTSDKTVYTAFIIQNDNFLYENCTNKCNIIIA